MNRLEIARMQAARRKVRVRKVINGTYDRPRLSVHISDKNVTAQIINDQEGKTLAHSTSVGLKAATGNLTEKATWVGTEIAKKAKSKKIKKVVFDRNNKLYHGRIKALADAARKEGLEF